MELICVHSLLIWVEGRSEDEADQLMICAICAQSMKFKKIFGSETK